MRRHAAIERRRWSASPGEKPAATMASCITCSWKIGTPSVRSSTLVTASLRIGHRLEPLPAPQVGVHHAALDRPGPHDRDLDDEVVEVRGLAGAAASTSARATRSGTRRRCRLLDHLVDRRVLGRDVLHRAADHRQRAADRGEHAQRQAVDLEQAHGVEVVLVPLDHRAVGHRRVLDRHHALEQVAGDDEAADVLRQVAREAHQPAGQRRQPPDHRRCRDRSRPRGCARAARRGRPTTRTRRRGGRPARGRARAPCRRRAPRSSAGR